MDSSCSAACYQSGYIFFGTVMTSKTSADCWCGNNIAYVTRFVTHYELEKTLLTRLHSTAGFLGSASVTGEAGEENCFPCIGAALGQGTVGECGNSTIMTIAIFARTF